MAAETQELPLRDLSIHGISGDRADSDHGRGWPKDRA